jgi:hypothetical protein
MLVRAVRPDKSTDVKALPDRNAELPMLVKLVQPDKSIDVKAVPENA